MTPRLESVVARLERLTGHTVSAEYDDKKYQWRFVLVDKSDDACWCSLVVVAPSLREVEAKALRQNLDHQRSRLMLKQKGRCAHCGAARALQVHHRVFRSHGRDDRIANLVAICLACHGEMHGVERRACHRRKTGDIAWHQLA